MNESPSDRQNLDEMAVMVVVPRGTGCSGVCGGGCGGENRTTTVEEASSNFQTTPEPHLHTRPSYSSSQNRNHQLFIKWNQMIKRMFNILLILPSIDSMDFFGLHVEFQVKIPYPVPSARVFFGSVLETFISVTRSEASN